MNFPTNIKRIRIDVGTGSTAPNAALWLKNNKNTAVLCFEADPRSYNILVNGGDTNQYPNELRLTKKHLLVFKNKLIKKIEPSLVKIYNVAISNSNNDDFINQLKQLNDLYKSGVLTKEEFEKAKKKILN